MLDLEQHVAKLGFEPERHVLRSWKTGRALAMTCDVVSIGLLLSRSPCHSDWRPLGVTWTRRVCASSALKLHAALKADFSRLARHFIALAETEWRLSGRSQGSRPSGSLDACGHLRPPRRSVRCQPSCQLVRCSGGGAGKIDRLSCEGPVLQRIVEGHRLRPSL
jgi:hypothetical protein